MSTHDINVGDLVKMNQGYSAPGLILEFFTIGSAARWARILWSDHGLATEKVRDLKLISRKEK